MWTEVGGRRMTRYGQKMSWSQFWKSLMDSFGAIDNIEMELLNGDIFKASIDGSVIIKKEGE